MMNRWLIIENWKMIEIREMDAPEIGHFSSYVYNGKKYKETLHGMSNFSLHLLIIFQFDSVLGDSNGGQLTRSIPYLVSLLLP